MNPVAPQPTGSSDAAAALKGASLAFQNQKSQSPAPTTPLHKRDNGALTAATASSSAASRSTSPPKRLGPQTTGGSSANDAEGHGHGMGSRSGGLVRVNGSGGGFLHAGVDTKSPSFIAATLAASRSASPSPMQRTPRRVASVGGDGRASTSDAVESLSIPPTTSLISMFERGRAGDPVKRDSPRSIPTASSEESLPESWQAPVKLPGIAKTQSIPARQPVSSGGIVSETVRLKGGAPPRITSATPESKIATRTFIADVAESKKSTPPRHTVKITPASPSQKLNPVTMPAPAPAKVSHEDVDSQQAQRIALMQPEALTPAKPKPKPKPRLVTDPAPSKEPLSSPKPRTTRQEEKIVPMSPSEVPKPAKPKPAPLNPVPKVISHSTPEVLSPKPTRPAKPILQVSHSSPKKNVSPGTEPQHTVTQSKRPPTPPKPRGSNNKIPAITTSTRFIKSASDVGTGEPHKPKAMALVHARDRSDTMSTDDSFVSASSYQSLERPSPPLFPARRGSGTASIVSAPSPSRGTPRPHNLSTSNLGLSNLTNAIMAGSLASARLTPHNTGSSLPPSLPKRQKSPHLRETLRKPSSVEPEDPGHYKPHKHKLSRGKHKHHEGSRKRWRDQITPRERKRYEALWASNRGVLLPPTVPCPSPSPSITNGRRLRDTTDLVANVIVRELWRRSRLPEDELAEVWDLVDREKRGWLGRQEFVVGMWLIDQRLKGRKIPLKVSDSVWSSANGVSVKKPKSK